MPVILTLLQFDWITNIPDWIIGGIKRSKFKLLTNRKTIKCSNSQPNTRSTQPVNSLTFQISMTLTIDYGKDNPDTDVWLRSEIPPSSLNIDYESL